MKAAVLSLLLSFVIHSMPAWACASTGEVCTGNNPCCNFSDECVRSGDFNNDRGICMDMEPDFDFFLASIQQPADSVRTESSAR